VELRKADRVEDVVGVAEQDAQLALVLDGPAEIGAEEREVGLGLDGRGADERAEDLRRRRDLTPRGRSGEYGQQECGACEASNHRRDYT
jgi:hypothetical protein